MQSIIALIRLGFPWASDINSLTKLHTATRRLILQQAHRHTINSASIACKHTISYSISLPCPGFFSPFPRGTCSLSVASQYLALPDGPGGFIQDFSCPVLLGILLKFRTFRLPDYHRLWYCFPGSFNYALPISL